MSRPIPEIEGVEHRFVSAGGLRTHLAEAGDGPPLLLLHGWPQHWWMWRKLIAPLAERHRVLVPDLRGFGWTDAPPGGYDPEVFARDVLALLDALEIEEPVGLVGHDWGGWTGYMLCLRHPERVSRFLAVNIYHPFVGPTPRALLSAWRFWYQAVIALPAFFPGALGGRSEGIGSALAWIGGNEAGWNGEERETFLAQFRDRDRAMAAALLYRHALLHIVIGSIRGGGYRRLQLETPTLLLFGCRDRVLDHRALPGFERNAPRMRLELVPDAGHFIVDQKPELVLDRARELFEAG